MKQRILVLNGQRLVQSEHAGQWSTDKVEKAANVKPGIYPIYLATAADKGKAHNGQIIHIDNVNVYQQIGKNLIFHDRDNFEKLPEVGMDASLRYSDDKCAVAPSSIKRGRKI